MKERNTSLDLLRILAMLMIVAIHVNKWSGILDSATTLQPASVLFNASQAVFSTSVNCFVLISGYFLCEKKFKLSGLIKIWIKVFVISAGFAITFKVFNIASVSAQDLFKAFLPVSYNQYWFITCYFVMFLLSPVLNIIIANTDEKKLRISIIIILFITCIWDCITPLIDATNMQSGYTFVWFVTLYLVAAYIKKYVNLEKFKKAWLGFVLPILFIVAFWAVITYISAGHPAITKFVNPTYFYSYNSIPIFIASVSVFIIFRRMKIKSSGFGKVITFVAPLTLGVYLFQSNKFFSDWLWATLFPEETFDVTFALYARAFITVIGVFVACCIVDFILTKILNLIILKRKWFTGLMTRIDAKVETWF